MKKCFVAALAAAALSLCLTGCGGPAVLTAKASEADEAAKADEAKDAGESDGTGDALSGGGADEETGQPGTIVVQITGFVRHPGVYEIQEGARLYELIDLAGGFLEDAASDYINQVEVLSDGQMVRIPNEEDYFFDLKAEEEAKSGLVNINTADEAQLCTLSGIGAGKAAAIIKYREENGGFSTKEDLKNVSGIGDSTYSKLEDFITAD